MTSEEKLESLKAHITVLKEVEEKIRTVRQDLELEAKRIVEAPNLEQ